MPYTDKDCLRARADFPSLSRRMGEVTMAYLDGPGGTQVPGRVIDAVSDYYRSSNANTHGMFITSHETDQIMDRARDAVAAFLGAGSGAQVSFGANMTTLTYALSHALVRKMSPGDEILITELDHEANRSPWLMLTEHGMVVKEVRMQRDGTLDLEDMAAKLGPRTRVLALGLASNALGTVNDVRVARELSRQAGAWLVLDAVHYAPHFPLDVQAMDADFLLCSAYKFYGPHVGILYSRPGLLDQLDTDRLSTQDPHAPYRIETGTLNHAAIAGVLAAIEYVAGFGRGDTLYEQVHSAKQDIAEYEFHLASRYWKELQELPGVTAWGPDFSSRQRAPTVSITVEGVPAGEVARQLAAAALLVWDGDFYAQRAVQRLGLAGQGGLLRTGFSMYNTDQEVDRLLHGLASLKRS